MRHTRQLVGPSTGPAYPLVCAPHPRNLPACYDLVKAFCTHMDAICATPETYALASPMCTDEAWSRPLSTLREPGSLLDYIENYGRGVFLDSVRSDAYQRVKAACEGACMDVLSFVFHFGLTCTVPCQTPMPSPWRTTSRATQVLWQRYKKLIITLAKV